MGTVACSKSQMSARLASAVRVVSGIATVEKTTIDEESFWKTFHAGEIFPLLLTITRAGTAGFPAFTRFFAECFTGNSHAHVIGGDCARAGDHCIHLRADFGEERFVRRRGETCRGVIAGGNLAVGGERKVCHQPWELGFHASFSICCSTAATSSSISWRCMPPLGRYMR